jgi:hypothetical protein
VAAALPYVSLLGWTWRAQAVWRAHGLKGFYRGALLNVLRAAPSQAVQFLVFDQLKGRFDV